MLIILVIVIFSPDFEVKAGDFHHCQHRGHNPFNLSPDFEVKATKISKTTDGYLALRAPLPLHLPKNDNDVIII